MDVLPPEDGLPLWQPAQVFAVGLEVLNEACDGVAETVGTFSCAPNSARIRNEAETKMSNGVRNFFNFETPWKNLSESQCRELSRDILLLPVLAPPSPVPPNCFHLRSHFVHEQN